MNNDPSSRPAAAVMPGDVWGASVEEEVARPYVLGPHLHQQRAHSSAGLSYWLAFVCAGNMGLSALRKRFCAAGPRAWVGRRKLDRLGTDAEDIDS